MKKVTITLVALFTVVSFVSAVDKKDTVTSNNAIVVQQNFNKGLDKQKMVKPRKQSNWSKIKDLFM